MDTLRFEPSAFRMRSGRDTTTPCAPMHTTIEYNEKHLFYDIEGTIRLRPEHVGGNFSGPDQSTCFLGPPTFGTPHYLIPERPRISPAQCVRTHKQWLECFWGFWGWFLNCGSNMRIFEGFDLSWLLPGGGRDSTEEREILRLLELTIETIPRSALRAHAATACDTQESLRIRLRIVISQR